MARALASTALIAVLASIASAAPVLPEPLGANVIVDGSLSSPITSASVWTAGIDATGVWQGMDYSNAAGYAELTFVGSGGNRQQQEQDQRSLVQVCFMPPPGTYLLELLAQVSDYATQVASWQVLLLDDSAELSLTGNPLDGGSGGHIRKVDKGRVKRKEADGQWHTFSADFAISPTDAASYGYLALVLTGSKSRVEQSLGFDSVSITGTEEPDGAGTTPQPSTVILFALGGTIALRRWLGCKIASSH
ncbi:MAG TPA: hypothetical protein VMZ31_07680 [Phycisphaerae bacterium]|nr:hypothetical protein [Phycisphaerae bacterium]